MAVYETMAITGSQTGCLYCWRCLRAVVTNKADLLSRLSALRYGEEQLRLLDETYQSLRKD